MAIPRQTLQELGQNHFDRFLLPSPVGACRTTAWWSFAWQTAWRYSLCLPLSKERTNGLVSDSFPPE